MSNVSLSVLALARAGHCRAHRHLRFLGRSGPTGAVWRIPASAHPNWVAQGIAFNAKPKVQKLAQFRINKKDLNAVLYLFGISEADVALLDSQAQQQAQVQ